MYHPYRNTRRRVHNSWLPDWMAEFLIFGVLFVLLVLLSFGCAATVPESKAVNAAQDLGYTNIEVVDKAFFFVGLRGCDKNDIVRFTVRGISPAGEERELYVCAGVFKGGTVRSK